MPSTLVLGGARSGKSRHAERLADTWLKSNANGSRVYIATAQVFDDEMGERVVLHQQQRGDNWLTVEEPFDLYQTLQTYAQTDTFVLIDCITLWLTNLMLNDKDYEADVEHLCALLPKLPGTVALVSNEVGLGIVPENKLARQFRDAAGIANQKLAEACDDVVFVAAGLSLKMK